MYSSLDRVDIVLKEKDGRKQYVQTDHRTAAEIEEEPELSVLFALTRVLNPRRMAEAGEPEPAVYYLVHSPPPEFLRRAIRAAGGRLAFGTDLPSGVEPGDCPPLEELVASAFADMARAVAAEYAVEVTPEGLKVVEDALAAEPADPEEDEIGYWSAVVKLGSFGGELIRASNGGRWVVADSGSLPFALSTTFQGQQATVNPLGKAIKRFANGEEDSLVFLADMIRSRP